MLAVVYVYVHDLASSATDNSTYSLTDFLSLDMKNKVTLCMT